MEPKRGSPGVFSWDVWLRGAIIFLPAVLLTAGIVHVVYDHDLAMEHVLHEQAGTHLVDLQCEIIRSEFKAVHSDLVYLANQAMLIDFLSGGPTSKERLEGDYVDFSRYRGIYDQIRYLDATGQERVRVNWQESQAVSVPAGGLQSKANRYYFLATMRLKRGGVFISPLDLNIEHDKIEQPLKPVIRFATPVFDRRGNKKGILVLNYLGAGLIHKLSQVSGTFPGQSLLLNADGYYLRGATSEAEWGFMLGHQRTFAADFAEEWRRFATIRIGQFRTERGLFTFRTITPEDPFLGRPAAAVPQTPLVPQGTVIDPDAADPSLIVMSHIPAALPTSPSALLLRRLLLLSGVVLLLLFGLAWYLAYAGAQRRYQERQLADSEGRLRALSSQLITAQEDERRKLSRDLHDELGQIVTAITLDLQRAAQTAHEDKKNELIGRGLHEARLLLSGIQEISARIRPTILDDLGLKEAVQNLLSEFERHTGIMPRSKLEFDGQVLPPAVAENIYRILQEALTNVSKHSQAEEVAVELCVADRQVALAVRDKGKGFALEALDGKELGLLGMRERAELLGGTFAVTAAPGQGAAIDVTIPLGRGNKT
ncbi:MAG: hypothetical protein FJ271_01245 [Planctomycetes bacterium]|nr:hypothetical protein [Planctomycetota bacterium]